jgi:hypothetical protein
MPDNSIQLSALGEVMAARRYEMTAFEADAWLSVIEAVPQERFLAFLKHHYATSPFAPTPSDATKHLDLSINPEVAFEDLRRLVRELGPYRTPVNVTPLLAHTIEALGGWVQVNAIMPDITNKQELRAFRERFDSAFGTSIVKVRIEGVKETPLLRSIPDVQKDTLALMHQRAALGCSGSLPLSIERSRCE